MNHHVRKCLNSLFDKYKVTNNERKKILKIIRPIIEHDEFQKRFENNFFHHSDITLGEHILEDTIVTYKLSGKYLNKNDFNLMVALMISMFHDLYTVPWQNNLIKTIKFCNKHGFRHPIEAVINAVCWYPWAFNDIDDAKKIIDGIVHHMFPFPVRSFTNLDNNELELKNYELLNNMPDMVKDILISSVNRFKIGNLSFTRSKYLEGRIMSKADRYVSIHQIKNLSSLLSLVTGKNKSINE